MLERGFARVNVGKLVDYRPSLCVQDLTRHAPVTIYAMILELQTLDALPVEMIQCSFQLRIIAKRLGQRIRDFW
jgi:hypothetical protein